MNKQEAVKIIKQITLYYPQFDKNISEELVQSWTVILMRHDSRKVMENLYDHVQTSSYTPTIHDLVKEREKIVKQDAYLLNEPKSEQELIERAAKLNELIQDGKISREDLQRWSKS